MKFTYVLKAVAVSMLVAGCAAGPAPTEQVTKSQAAIRAAEEVGAEKAPQAELHLQLAREQAEEAKRLIEDGQNQRAKIVLARSEADAELALALAREAEMRKEASETMEQVNKLQQALP